MRQQLGGLFHTVNTNGDGVVLATVDEFAVYQLYGSGSFERRVHARGHLTSIDTDKNGEISYEDWSFEMKAAED